jgi:hypothetical protein
VATEAHLRAFEKRKRVVLPSDYRAFAKTFGAGTLGGFVRIAAPTERPRAFNLRHFDKLWDTVRDAQCETYGERHRELFERAILFADSVGGDLFVWDTGAPSDGGHDWPIVVLPRSGTRLLRVRGGIRDFLGKWCMGRRPRGLGDLRNAATFTQGL